ncbi:MAG: DUF2218 domain-containing protein [Candidatus Thiodiazotropha sp. (ex Ctena orbiculata)]|nr:DUF2218 domain-containing protein [Candidatus Thiodiazotropha taylori]
MPKASLTLRADKSHAYFDSLCKHFARKVDVARDGDSASVAFPMGECTMQVDNKLMCFVVHAQDQQALETLKTIVASHAVRYGELKDAPIDWSD